MPEESSCIHPAIWPLIIGVGGLILGVGGSVVWVGGALRQIDINTHRLDSLELTGSPIVQAIKADLQATHVSLNEVVRQSEKTSDVLMDRGKLLAQHEESIRQLTTDIRTLEQFSRDTSERRAALSALVAQIEGKMAGLEKSQEDIRTSLRRMRDDIQQHEHDDITNLRDTLNALRGRTNGETKKPDRDEK